MSKLTSVTGITSKLKGGAIGVGIAGDVANLFMVWWDKQVKMKLEKRWNKCSNVFKIRR